MIWHEPEDQHWKSRKVYSEKILWFLYFQNLEITQLEKGHSRFCFDQDVVLDHFQLNCLMTIQDVAYRTPVVLLAELMVSFTRKIKLNFNHVPERANLIALAFTSQEANWFSAICSGKSPLREEPPKDISEWQVLCHCYYRQPASAVFWKAQVLIFSLHPIFLCLFHPQVLNPSSVCQYQYVAPTPIIFSPN